MADTESEVKTLASTSSPPSSSTVYINNLNESVKVDVLKQSLSALFSTYGPVLSITAHGNLRMRGQAFVAFDDGEVAAKAIKEVNGFPLYGKPMQLSFAKTPSDSVLIKHTGATSNEYTTHKTARLSRKALATEQRKAEQRAQRKARSSGVKRKRPDEDLSDADGVPTKKQIPQMPDEYLPPNPILFIQNVPSGGENTKSQLEQLFGQFTGMLDVRTIPNNDSIAFVEFGSAEESGRARDSLNGAKLLGHAEGERGIRVTFARA